MEKTRDAFYSVAQTVVDAIVKVDGIEIGMFTRKTEAQLRLEYQDLARGTWEEAEAKVEEAYITQVEASTEAEFWSYLGAVPPLCRNVTGETESFKMSEMKFGCVTFIGVRIGERFFKFYDKKSLSHQQVIEKTRRHLASIEASAAESA